MAVMIPVMSADCEAPDWSWLARLAMLFASSVSVDCRALMSAPRSWRPRWS